MIDQRRRRLVDVAFVATALVTGAAAFSNQARQGGWPGWAVAAGTAGGIAACAALWFRRRSPVGVAVTILPLALVTSFAAPAGLLAFFTVALYRRLAVVLWLGVPALAALCIAFALQAGDRPETGVSLWLSLSVVVL